MATEANYVKTCPVNRVDHNMNKKQEAQAEGKTFLFNSESF